MTAAEIDERVLQLYRLADNIFCRHLDGRHPHFTQFTIALGDEVVWTGRVR